MEQLTDSEEASVDVCPVQVVLDNLNVLLECLVVLDVVLGQLHPSKECFVKGLVNALLIA